MKVSSSAFPTRSLGFANLGEIFACVTLFWLVLFCFLKSNHKGSQILSSWMVHAGCVFVAGIHPFRT